VTKVLQKLLLLKPNRGNQTFKEIAKWKQSASKYT